LPIPFLPLKDDPENESRDNGQENQASKGFFIHKYLLDSEMAEINR